MEKKQLILSLGSGKRSRGILYLCIIILILFAAIGAAAWNLPAGKAAAVYQILNVPVDKITCIDVSNGAGPQVKITESSDIKRLLSPFMKIKVRKASAFKNSAIKHSLSGRSGAEGLYFVIYKDGSPYVHMEYFKPKLFNICLNEQAQSKVLYTALKNVDTVSVNTILSKYHINKI